MNFWHRHSLERCIAHNTAIAHPNRLKTSDLNRTWSKMDIRDCLRGINGVELNILTVWIVANDTTQFVTLVLNKRAHS
jgi:hypothetical protein